MGSSLSARLTADAMESDRLPRIVPTKCLLQIISRLKEVKSCGPTFQLNRGQHNSLIFIDLLLCTKHIVTGLWTWSVIYIAKNGIPGQWCLNPQRHL